MEDLKKYNNWLKHAKKYPGKTILFVIVGLILIGVVGYMGTYYSEKAKQKFKPSSPSNLPIQTATGNGNMQMITNGDNSPIIVNRKEFLSHKIQRTSLCYNEPQKDIFVTKVEFYSQHPIPNVYFAAYAKTIVEFDVIPQGVCGLMSGHSGKREDFWFTNIPNFGGKYLLVVKTKKSEKIKIECDIE